jgi:hypothetical protein
MLTAESREGIWVPLDGNLIAGGDSEIPLQELFTEVDKIIQS